MQPTRFRLADSGDLTFDSLDGFVQAIAGISDDDDSEVTEEQDDAYNEAWANVADFLAACGVDDDLIEHWLTMKTTTQLLMLVPLSLV